MPLTLRLINSNRTVGTARTSGANGLRSHWPRDSSAPCRRAARSVRIVLFRSPLPAWTFCSAVPRPIHTRIQSTMLWEVEVHPAACRPDREGARVLKQCQALAADSIREVHGARSFLIQGDVSASAIERIAAGFLADTVVETYTAHELAGAGGATRPAPSATVGTLLNGPHAGVRLRHRIRSNPCA